MADTRQLQSVPVRWDSIPDWMRRVATSLNGMVAGGPHRLLWKNQTLDLSSAKLGGNDPAFLTTQGGLKAYKFVDTGGEGTEELFFNIVIPYEVARGEDMYPTVHWTSDSTNTGAVRWGFEYMMVKVDGVFPSPTTTYVAQAFSGTAWTHTLAEFGTPISSIDYLPGTTMSVRLFRDSGDAADTFTGGAFALAFSLQYQAEFLGTAYRLENHYEPG